MPSVRLPRQQLATGLAVAMLCGATGAASAANSSYRDGGDATYTEVHPPDRWDASHTRWRVPLDAWSNSSPVVLDGLVCTSSEPVRLSCYDLATGALRWQEDSPYAVTVAPSERAVWEARVADHQAAVAEADALQVTYSRLRRELRRSPSDAALGEQLAGAGARLATLRATLADAPPFETPPVREIIGYSTHSPVTDGARIYALFGQGVVTAFAPSGKRVWSTFVGPAPERMRGYHVGTAATPVLVDGLLIIGHGHLIALDTATGRVVWTGPAYQDYGTPAVAVVGGVTVIATPAGQLVRAKDGVVLQEGLDDPWFTGPAVEGELLVYAGAHASDLNNAPESSTVSAWTLSMADGKVRATRAWSQALPNHERIYVPPVVHDGTAYVVDTSGTVWAASAGQLRQVAQERLGPVYPAPLIVQGHLLIGGELGRFVELDLPSGAFVREQQVGLTRATPVFVGGSVYVRALDALIAVGSP